MNVTLLDLGVGNLHSLAKAFARALPEARVAITSDPSEPIARFDARESRELLVLPGVGAFGAAATTIAPFRPSIRAALDRGLPCIGICLGMQLLFEASDEGDGEGLGLLRGRVTRLATTRSPHMGWSPIEPVEPDEWASAGRPRPSAVYYAHSFACRPIDSAVVLATTTIDGDRFPAIVRAKRAIGCQFHPEKSSDEGVRLLGALAREVIA